MAASRRAAKKRSRPRKKRRGGDPLPLLLQLEEPLRDVTNYTDALRLIGHGLTAHDETGGDAVAALAYAAGDRLEVVREIWNRIVEEKRRARRVRRPG